MKVAGGRTPAQDRTVNTLKKVMEVKDEPSNLFFQIIDYCIAGERLEYFPGRLSNGTAE
jgi:hypothetical protein